MNRAQRRMWRFDVLARDHGRCAACPSEQPPWPPEAWQADHIHPVDDGGLDELANMQTLCLGHHRIKSLSERARLDRPPQPQWESQRRTDLTYAPRPPRPVKPAPPVIALPPEQSWVSLSEAVKAGILPQKTINAARLAAKRSPFLQSQSRRREGDPSGTREWPRSVLERYARERSNA